MIDSVFFSFSVDKFLLFNRAKFLSFCNEFAFDIYCDTKVSNKKSLLIHVT